LPQDLSLSAQAGKVTLQNSEVSVSNDGGSDGGSIYIRAGQFFMDNTTVRADTNSATEGAEGGRINVRANELRASHGGQFRSENYGVGQGGKIKINITGLTEFSGEIVDENGEVTNSGIRIASEKGGDGGSIALETGTLNLKGAAFIETPTY
jgi:hypothetical protein